MRIRIAFLLTVGVLGIVFAVAAAAATLMRPPTPTVVGPIEVKVEDGAGGDAGKKGNGGQKDNGGGKDSNQPTGSDGGATTVPTTPIPAGDDDGDDNSGPGDDDGDDNSGPGDDDGDDNSGPGDDDGDDNSGPGSDDERPGGGDG